MSGAATGVCSSGEAYAAAVHIRWSWYQKAAAVVLICSCVKMDWSEALVVVCSCSDFYMKWDESAATRCTAI